MAHLPLPGAAERSAHDAAELTRLPVVGADDQLVTFDLPQTVGHALRTLAEAGHEAVLVGGCVRDRLLGTTPVGDDWDAATSARPEAVAALFPDATWENRFGTVTVRRHPTVEVTSYRTEGTYRDARRPDEVRFGVSLAEDLARRDFTINAIAWVPIDLDAGIGRILDPFDGRRDLDRRVLRTVGDPHARFTDDALRLVRAARFAGTLGLTIDAATEAAIVSLASRAGGVSGERVRDELVRILERDPRPSAALRLLERLGLMAVVLPELTALRGVPQAKRVPGDALDHSLAAVDAAPPDTPDDVRLTALLHDVGKATTQAAGHFIGHEDAGAEIAAAVLDRLRLGRGRSTRIVAVIRHHMYNYDATWTDAAVRRFVRRLAGVDLDLLFALRRADDAASGTAATGELAQAELERRIREQIESQPELLGGRRLAIDGHDLQELLGLAPGPGIGRLMDRLMEAAIEDPSLNDRERLLELARVMSAGR